MQSVTIQDNNLETARRFQGASPNRADRFAVCRRLIRILYPALLGNSSKADLSYKGVNHRLQRLFAECLGKEAAVVIQQVELEIKNERVGKDG